MKLSFTLVAIDVIEIGDVLLDPSAQILPAKLISKVIIGSCVPQVLYGYLIVEVGNALASLRGDALLATPGL